MVIFISRRMLGIGLFLVLIIACGQASSPASADKVKAGAESKVEMAPRIGYRPPNFTLKDLQGKTVELENFRGKVIFINFWATWCVPCRAEMPAIEELYQQFKDKDFVVLAVSEDLAGMSIVAPFVEELKLTFPILLDPDLSIQDRYGIRALPSTFLIDKTGIITHKMLGARDWTQKQTLELVRKLVLAK